MEMCLSRIIKTLTIQKRYDILPIYSGDAEIFNNSAKRFKEEELKHMMNGKEFTKF